jgi:hypothetical protein
MSSRTQVDFRGSSIQAGSVTTGRLASETSLAVDPISSRTVYTDGVTGAPAALTLPSAGVYVIDGVAGDSSWSTSVNVRKINGTLLAVGGATVPGTSPSGDLTFAGTAGVVTYARANNTVADVITLSARRL